MHMRRIPAALPVVAVLLLTGCGDGPAEPEVVRPAVPAMLPARTLDPLHVAYTDVVSRLLPAMDPATARALRPAFGPLRSALLTGEVSVLESALARARERTPPHVEDADATAALLVLDQIGRALEQRQHENAGTKETAQ